MNASEPQSLQSLWSLVLDHHDLAHHDLIQDDTADHIAQLLTHHRLLERTHRLTNAATAVPTGGQKRNGSAATTIKQLTAMSARFQGIVNSLLAASKSSHARLVGMLLAQIWLEQVPEIVREGGLALSWANTLLNIVSRAVDPIPLRTHASHLLVLLITTAARFPDSSRDVAAPTVAKFAPILLRWTSPASSPSPFSLQREGLTAISRLATSTPTSLRPFALQAQSNAFVLLFTQSHQRLAARTIARLVPLAAKGDAPTAWTGHLTQALATAHTALDVLLAPLDEDDTGLPAPIRDAGPLPGTLTLPAAEPTLTPVSARLATHVFTSAVCLVSHLISTRLPVASVTVPTALLLATTGRVLSALSLSPLPTASAAAATLAAAQVPLLAQSALSSLILPLVQSAAAAGALASLAPHATPLGALIARALYSSLTPAVRTVALDVISAGLAQIFPMDAVVKSLGTPHVAQDLARGCPATLAAVAACIAAQGARVPTHVRAVWDGVLVPQALAGRQGDLVNRVTRVSAMVPSVVASAGVPAYASLTLVGYAATVGAGTPGDEAKAMMDAVVHPRRVVDVQPVLVVKDKIQVGAGQVATQAQGAGQGMFVDPAQVAAQLVDGSGRSVENEDQEEGEEEEEAADDMQLESAIVATDPVALPPSGVAVVAPRPAPAAPSAPVASAPKPKVYVDSMQVDQVTGGEEEEEDEEGDEEDLMHGIEIVDSGPDSDEDDE